MKLAIAGLLLVVFAARADAQGAPAASPPASAKAPEQQNADKAKALLDQMVNALGGNAYLNIEGISQEGRSYSFHNGQPNGVGVVFWRFYRYPDKERIELTK